MRTLRTKLSAATTTLGLALAMSPAVRAAGVADRMMPPGYNNNNPYNNYDACRVPSTVQISVRRWLQDSNSTLALRQLAGLDQSCNGRMVRRVIVLASSSGGFSQATLMINNRAASYAQRIAPGNLQQIVLDLDPRSRNVLGQDIQQLQVALQGRVYVEQVTVITQPANNIPPPAPYPQPYPQPQPGPGPRPGPQPSPYPTPQPAPYPQPGPSPHPGPQPGPGPHPGPGPRPGPQPSPYPAPAPAPQQHVWAPSAQGGYYDATGQIQGAHRLAEIRMYGGIFTSGEPIPMVPVLVNLVGQTCNIPSTAPGLGVCVPPNPVHYE